LCSFFFRFSEDGGRFSTETSAFLGNKTVFNFFVWDRRTNKQRKKKEERTIEIDNIILVPKTDFLQD